MPLDEPAERLLGELIAASVEFIVVGGLAAVLQGAPIVTQDIDIVHRRSEENVDRLLALLHRLGAFNRFDLANRRLPPSRAGLLGHGRSNLQTALGPLDVLCELDGGAGYDELLAESILLPDPELPLRVLALPRLIQAKAAAARPKDKMVLPILIATLEERAKRK